MLRSIALPLLLSGCVAEARAQTAPSTDASAPRAAARCLRDEQCGWDEACAPTRCVLGGARRPARCEESAPEPGECRCLLGACTLRRNDLATTRSPETGCRTSAECGLEPSTGVCRVRRGSSTPPITPGDRFCDCERSSGACVERTLEPVRCRSWRDCSWTYSPLRAVSARQVRRPVARPVRACRDAEVDSRCVDGTCVIVAWRC
jgi:hypothetical protein